MQRYSSRVSKAPIGKPRGLNLLLLSILITGGLVGGTAMAAGSVIDAENSFVSHGIVVALDGNFTPIANASSTMLRNRHGVTVSLNTTGLEPEAAHTIWFLVFNNPEFCTGSPGLDCDPGAGDLANPAVQGSVFWAAGRVSDAFGQISLDGTVFEGVSPGQVLSGPGLIDSLKADIHVIVRSHGSAAALEGAGQQLEAALTTVGGGCGVNACADVQAVAHQQ